MKREEWEKAHDYGSHRVCKNCEYSVSKDRAYGTLIECTEKKEAGAGEVVKPNHSCRLWCRKK
jgi:hypothetical protein